MDKVKNDMTREQAASAINSIVDGFKELTERVDDDRATIADLKTWKEKALPEFEEAVKKVQDLNRTLPEGVSDKDAKYAVPKSYRAKIAGSNRSYKGERLADAYLCQIPAQKGSDLERYHHISDALRFCPRGASPRKALVEEARQLQAKLTGKAALDTTSESEWVPAEALSATLQDLVRENTPVANAFMRVPMPNQVTKIPVLSADASVYWMSEATLEQENGSAVRVTSSQPTSAQMTLTARKFAVRIPSSTEQFEENAFDMAAFLASYPAILIGEQIDNAIINGDNTSASASHFDTGRALASTSPLVAWDGLRYLCNSGTTQTSASSATALTLAHLVTVFGKGGKWFNPTTNGGGAVMFAPYSICLEAAALGATWTSYTGQAQMAPIISGAVGSILGVEVVPTQYYPVTENASGVVDGTTASVETGFLVANRGNFKMGDRRAMTIKTDEEITFDQIETVVTWRGAFAAAIAPSTTNPTAWRLYNLDA